MDLINKFDKKISIAVFFKLIRVSLLNTSILIIFRVVRFIFKILRFVLNIMAIVSYNACNNATRIPGF